MDAPKDPVLLTAWLERAPSHVAAAWVSSVGVKDSTFHSPFTENVLKILKARNDRFLDLAIALHGDDGEILRELWATGDPGIRRAVLSNQNRDRRWLFQHDDVPCFLTPETFESFLAEADASDVEAFVTNPRLEEDNLSAVFERKSYWAKLPDQRWQQVAVLALMNPNLHMHIHMDIGDEDFEQYLDRRPISEALRLVFEVPAEEPWAAALVHGFDRFPHLDPPTEMPEDIALMDPMFENWPDKFHAWQAKTRREFLERAFTRWTLKEDDEPRGKARVFPKQSAVLRMTLATKVRSYHGDLGEWLENHQDKWVRIGAAIAKQFYKPEEVQRWYDRDGRAFLDAVYKNPSLHSRSRPDVVAEARSLLSRTEDAEEAQGYDWDYMQYARHNWSQEADRLHSLAPLSYFSWNEEPESREARSDDPVVRAFQELKHRLDNLVRTATAGDQRRRGLEAVRALSETLGQLHAASQSREQRLGEATSLAVNLMRHELSLVRARITLALALIVILGLVVVFR